jgi:5-methylcytosine-specific restriction endonuclease McrA
MEKALGQEVRARAGNACEYCLMPQATSKLTFQIDHVIALQHGGETSSDNLALSCGRCNLSKDPNIAGIDPDTRQMRRLFNPRRDEWALHFRYDGPVLIGLSEVGHRCSCAPGAD